MCSRPFEVVLILSVLYLLFHACAKMEEIMLIDFLASFEETNCFAYLSILVVDMKLLSVCGVVRLFLHLAILTWTDLV